MLPLRTRLLTSAAIALAAPSLAWAWADHHLVTTAAIAPLTALSTKTVRYTEFSAMLKDLGYSSVVDFNTQMENHKEYLFTPQLGEVAGKDFAVGDVLAKYSDEPDWGMDKDLFGDDQYPQNWKPEYSMMGGKTGTPSQAPRHMYWQKLNFWHILKTFKLPLNKTFDSMGIAPDRAAMFLDLSRKARAKGHDYWSVRFLAYALHYLEDVSQPFHTTQVPTKEFLLMPIFDKSGDGMKEYVSQITNIVAYYHYCFEDYVSQLMRAAAEGDTTSIGNTFVQDLASITDGPSSLSYDSRDIAAEVRAMAKLGVAKSAAAGRAAKKFFPPITVDFATFSPDDYMDDNWWAGVIAAGARDSSEKKQYLKIVQDMFGPLGYAVRQVVQAEVLVDRDPAQVRAR